MRRKASRPFAENESNLLAFSLTHHYFGQLPSRTLGIQDEVAAYEFDQICAFALLKHENKRDSERLEGLIKSIGAIFGAKFSDSGNPANGGQ